MFNKFKSLFFFFTIIILLLPLIEISSFVLLKGYDFYLFQKKKSENLKIDFPEPMNYQEIGQFPLIRVHKDFNSKKYNTNNGFRANQSDMKILVNELKDYELDIYKKKKNILFLGGSTTFGVGSSDSGTFPEYFKNYNNEFNILNLGLGGNDQEGEILILEYFIKRLYKFDYVVFLDGINQDGCFFVNTPFNRDRIILTTDTKLKDFYTVQLFKKIFNKIVKIHLKENYVEFSISNDLMTKCANKFFKNIIYLNNFALSNKIKKIFIILQPSKGLVLNNDVRGYNQFYDLIIKHMSNYNKPLNSIALLDMRYSIEPKYFIDAHHLNDAGNEILSKKFNIHFHNIIN
jgi:hypothetical protein